MSPSFRWIFLAILILLFAVAFLAAVVSGSVVAALASVWLRGEYMAPRDFHTLMVREDRPGDERATGAFYLAKLSQCRGRPQCEVALWRDRALRWNRRPWLLRRIQAELPVS